MVVDEPLVAGSGTLGALAVPPALMAKFPDCHAQRIPIYHFEPDKLCSWSPENYDVSQSPFQVVLVRNYDNNMDRHFGRDGHSYSHWLWLDTTSRKLPTAERLARQTAQQSRLGGLIFNPDTIPANQLVDTFVEMLEHNTLTYVKPEQCISRAQEVSSVKKDQTIATDAQGVLKIATKSSEVSCDANSELKLRAAFQRRSLAMDLAGIASYDVIEPWIQFLFSQMLREQPRGFSRVTLQQLIDCDKQLFIMASHLTLGKLQSSPADPKPLDEAIKELKVSHEILQYLSPLPTIKHHEPPPIGPPRPTKVQKVGDDKDGKGKGKGKQSKINIPDGCTTHDAENKPLCFKFQTGKCSFKGPAGKRCAKGYHKCYKQGCYRPRPYFQCNHAD